MRCDFKVTAELFHPVYLKQLNPSLGGKSRGWRQAEIAPCLQNPSQARRGAHYSLRNISVCLIKMKTEAQQSPPSEKHQEDHRRYQSGYVLFNTGFFAQIKGTIYWALCVPSTLPNTICVISFPQQTYHGQVHFKDGGSVLVREQLESLSVNTAQDLHLEECSQKKRRIVALEGLAGVVGKQYFSPHNSRAFQLKSTFEGNSWLPQPNDILCVRS